MKGKSSFSTADANEIRAKLRELRCADRSDQKRIRGTLRKKFGFYITDFDTGGTGFSEYDFNVLVQRGLNNVPDTSPTVAIRTTKSLDTSPAAAPTIVAEGERTKFGSDNLTSVSGLRSLGFNGFVTVADLRSGSKNIVPAVPGVYLFLRDTA